MSDITIEQVVERWLVLYEYQDDLKGKMKESRKGSKAIHEPVYNYLAQQLHNTKQVTPQRALRLKSTEKPNILNLKMIADGYVQFHKIHHNREVLDPEVLAFLQYLKDLKSRTKKGTVVNIEVVKTQ